MKSSTLAELNKMRQQREAAVVVTNLVDGSERLLREAALPENELGQSVKRAFLTGRSSVVEVEGDRYFVNPYLPPARIVVIGAVHISQAMAPIARLADFDLEIIDPRTAFATPDRFPDTALFADWPLDILEGRPLDRYCALAAITHDPKIDDDALVAALSADCFYIGALGSRKTHAKRAERFASRGIGDAEISRIAAPIGLNIGAASPAEIAIAIMAQIIEAFRKRGLGESRVADQERVMIE